MSRRRAPAIFREVLAEHPCRTARRGRRPRSRLWDGATHREERYAATALARHRRYAAYRDASTLPLYRHLVVTGAWWDHVDEVAIHLVGPVLPAHPGEVTPVIRSWATDDDLLAAAYRRHLPGGAEGQTDIDLLLA